MAHDVFISYSSKDKIVADKICYGLETNKIKCWIAPRDVFAGSEYGESINSAIENCQSMILLFSANSNESAHIRKEVDLAVNNKKYIVTFRIENVFPSGALKYYLNNTHWLDAFSSPLEIKIDELIINISKLLSPKLITNPEEQNSNWKKLHSLNTLSEDLSEKSNKSKSQVFQSVSKKSPHVSLAHLPITGAARYGREEESKRLTAAWEQQKINILTVVGWGGEGKSSLINSWLASMAEDNYLGAEAVYGWCFYDAEMKNQEASADIFITSALQWLGDSNPNNGSPWERGVRLAELVRNQRILLILDGIETLQPLGLDVGHIKDQSFRAFLLELAAQNPGLCVISTRLSLTDLQSSLGKTVEEIFLKPLDFESGVQLLLNMGVRGQHSELIKATKEYGGHALSLTLLGSYLVEVCNGDILLRDQISSEQENKAEQVMASYENWLGEGPELQILRLLGVLSRTASLDAIDTLRAEPIINGVTNHILNLSNREWNRAVNRLRKLKLVAEINPLNPDILDTHPLVRQHFSNKLQNENPEGWKEANNRLFEYYKQLPQLQLPDRIDDVVYLFHAVAHGCKAGRHQEAWDEVYWPRIRREDVGFSVLTLNLYSADLVALTHFFDRCWDKPISALNELAKARLFTETAFDLRGLGRLKDAISPQRFGLNAHQSEKRWLAAADAAGNLSELLVTLGQLDQAIKDAKLSVELAKSSGDSIMLVTNLATLANALYLSGEIIQAENYFNEADENYKKQFPNTTQLHSLLIFHFCDLLIEKGNYQEVINRASASLQLEEDGKNQLRHRTGLSHLALASALIAECRFKKTQNYHSANQQVKSALENLRIAGHQELVVRGLLVSAELNQLQGNFAIAESELEEAAAIANRGQMKLYMVDTLLQNVQLQIALSQIPKAEEYLSIAREMILSTGYHLKDSVVRRLEIKILLQLSN